MDFPGVALVTGAGSGIGRATAMLYAKEGCKRIAVLDLNIKGAEETKAMIESAHAGTQVHFIECDIGSEESVSAAFSQAIETFGRLDYCANCAGVCITGESQGFAAQSFDLMYQVNTRGTWLCQKEEIKQMLKQALPETADGKYAIRGAIANVASMTGIRGYEGLPAYSATKHAIIGLSKSDALRYAREKIRINVVCPGLIETPMLNDAAPGYIEETTKTIACRRAGRPSEIAECLVWITSGRASFVYATTLVASGGVIAG